MATAELTSRINTSLQYHDRNRFVEDTSLKNVLHVYAGYKQNKAEFRIVQPLPRHTSTRDFSLVQRTIDTSQHLLSGTKDYLTFINSKEKDLIDVIKFTKTLEKIYAESSDKALVYIFATIDTWNSVDELFMFEKLFIEIDQKIFNEDVYVSILAATIAVKENIYRARYFNFVKKQLLFSYNEEEVSIILNGL